MSSSTMATEQYAAYLHTTDGNLPLDLNLQIFLISSSSMTAGTMCCSGYVKLTLRRKGKKQS